MRLILNKALDNINDNVNLKIIEITSTDFLNNDLDYFVYKYQIPLIKFTDTEEIFNIKAHRFFVACLQTRPEAPHCKTQLTRLR